MRPGGMGRRLCGAQRFFGRAGKMQPDCYQAPRPALTARRRDPVRERRRHQRVDGERIYRYSFLSLSARPHSCAHPGRQRTPKASKLNISESRRFGLVGFGTKSSSLALLANAMYYRSGFHKPDRFHRFGHDLLKVRATTWRGARKGVGVYEEQRMRQRGAINCIAAEDGR